MDNITQIAVTTARKLTVETPEELQQATTLLQTIKEELKRITDHKETVTKPLFQALQAERAKYKPIEDQLSQAIDHIRTQQATYATNEAKRLQEATTALQEGKLSLDQALTLATPTTTQGLTFRTTQVLEITDPAKIPRVYLQPNEEKITTALKEGKKVAGAVLVEKKIPVNRK